MEIKYSANCGVTVTRFTPCAIVRVFGDIRIDVAHPHAKELAEIAADLMDNVETLDADDWKGDRLFERVKELAGKEVSKELLSAWSDFLERRREAMAEGSAVESAVAEIRRQKDAEITRLSRAPEAERAKPTADDDAPMMASVLDETRDRLLAVHAMWAVIRNNVTENQTVNAICGLLFNLEDIAEGLETVIPCASGGLADRQRA